MKNLLSRLKAIGPSAAGVLGFVGIAVVVLYALLFAGGCQSGTKQIARSANNVAELATRVDEHATTLDTRTDGSKEAVLAVKGIHQAAADLHIEAGKVHEAVTKVKDIAPWWYTAIENITWIILLAGVLFALFYFGLAAPIRAFLVFIGSLVPAILPSRVKGQAKVDMESLEANPTPELDKTIAVRRAADPMYDAAWKAQKKKPEQPKEPQA